MAHHRCGHDITAIVREKLSLQEFWICYYEVSFIRSADGVFDVLPYFAADDLIIVQMRMWARVHFHSAY